MFLNMLAISVVKIVRKKIIAHAENEKTHKNFQTRIHCFRDVETI